MTRTQSTFAVLLLYFICLPFGLLLCALGLCSFIGRRAQFLAGWLFVRFMALTDPNNGGA